MYNGFRFVTFISIAVIATSVCVAQDDSLEASDCPVLTGPYLGQDQPGMIPMVFALGIVSNGYR